MTKELREWREQQEAGRKLTAAIDRQAAAQEIGLQVRVSPGTVGVTVGFENII